MQILAPTVNLRISNGKTWESLFSQLCLDISDIESCLTTVVPKNTKVYGYPYLSWKVQMPG